MISGGILAGKGGFGLRRVARRRAECPRPLVARAREARDLTTIHGWYDLAVPELSELSDPVKEKLVEAEKARGFPALEAEEPVASTSEEPA